MNDRQDDDERMERVAKLAAELIDREDDGLMYVIALAVPDTGNCSAYSSIPDPDRMVHFMRVTADGVEATVSEIQHGHISQGKVKIVGGDKH